MSPDLVAQGAQLAQCRVDVSMAMVGIGIGGSGSGGCFLMVDVVNQTQGVGGS